MSLGIAFKGSEGVVLAADSRVTLTVVMPSQLPGLPNQNLVVPATFDNATKLLRVKGQDHVGAVTYGAGAIGTTEPRTAHSFLSEFEAALVDVGRLGVRDFSTRLGDFFLRKWTERNMPVPAPEEQQMTFLIGGYDVGAAYGRLYEIKIPNAHEPVEQLVNEFGLLFGGQREFVDRLLRGYDSRVPDLVSSEMRLNAADRQRMVTRLNEVATPIPYQFLPLQDCVDLSVFLLRTTINLQTWQIGIRGVGGAIDVGAITQAEGFKLFEQKKVKVASKRQEYL